MIDKDDFMPIHTPSSDESLSSPDLQNVAQTKKTSQVNVSRRNFLAGGAFAAAALALPKAANASTTPAWYEGAIAAADTCSATITIPGAGTTFSNPKVWAASSGKLTLEAEMAGVDGSSAGLSSCVDHRTYKSNVAGSRQIPGPTIEVAPGGTIEIDFTNNLPVETTTCQANVPSCYNPSNIHFHGLHVSPGSTSAGVASDNVEITVDPGGGQQSYCVVLPDFHAPGTHWYHTHKHGSTAIQVEDGMLGAIIVKEPTEELNMVPGDRDQVWVLQEIINGNVYNKAAFNFDAQGNPTTSNQSGVFLVNGIYQPKITISAKRMYRWRMINGTATPRGLMALKMSGPSGAVNMYRMAVDGISFYGKKPQTGTKFDLSPGNRSDFLIWIEQPGTYTLKKIAPSGGVVGAGTTMTLATVEVTDDGFNDPEPSTLTIRGTLPSYLWPISKSEVLDDGSPRTKSLQFKINNKSGVKVAKINGQQYSPTTCVEVDLNTAEIWALQTLKGSTHPFHIHVNPFQVPGDLIDPDGPDDSSNWIWWDTIPVNPLNGGKGPIVPVVHRFPDYYGKFVLHCHVLIHEDQGMMVNVSVKDDGSGTGPCETLSASTFTPSGGDPITAEYVNQVAAGLSGTQSDFDTCPLKMNTF